MTEERTTRRAPMDGPGSDEPAIPPAGSGAPPTTDGDAPPTSDADAPAPRSVIGARTLTVVVLFVALELCLRHFGGFGQWTVSEQSERFGWRMLPDQSAWSRDLTIPEFINSDGFRDREWDPPRRDESGAWIKDESLYRVAVVGNSMTFGTSVLVEETWPRVLEGLLAEHLSARGDARRVLVMNFATQGYVFEQMARVYEDVVRPWRPDLLVVPFHPHDVMPMRPSQDDPEYDFRRWVLRTATFDMLNTWVINQWMPRVPAAERSKINWGALDQAINEQPFNRKHERYWTIAANRMEEILAMVEADGGRLAIAPLPRWRKFFNAALMGSESKWGPWAWERRPRVVHILARTAFEPLMAPVVAEIRAKGIEADNAADLSELTWTDADGRERSALELETAEQSLFLLDDTGHYTAAGHAALAREVFEGLVKAGVP